MVVNQQENNKAIQEANKWLGVLKEKKYLALSEGEKAAVKNIHNRLRNDVKAYQSVNASVSLVYDELVQVLDNQEGFFWKYA